jgi:hypothetical protein
MYNITTVRGLLTNTGVSLVCWALIGLLFPTFAVIGAFISVGGNGALLFFLLRDRFTSRKVLRLPRLSS